MIAVDQSDGLNGLSPGRHRIRAWVLVAHAGVLLTLIGLNLFQRFFQEEPRLLNVELVAAQRGAPSEGAGSTRPEPPAPEPEPRPPPPEPAQPEAPEAPEPPEPAPEQSEEPAQTVPAPEPARPKWRKRSVDEIRRSTLRKPTSPRRDTARQRREVEKRLSNLANKLTPVSNSTGASPPARRGGVDAASAYAAAVRDILYRHWKQPVLGATARKPVVRVRLSISRPGALLASSVKRTSGIALMDKSVIRVLKRVRQFPPLTSYGVSGSKLDIEVVFELDAR